MKRRGSRHNPAMGRYPDLFTGDFHTEVVVSDEELARMLYSTNAGGIIESELDEFLFAELEPHIQAQVRENNRAARKLVYDYFCDNLGADYAFFTEGEGANEQWDYLHDAIGRAGVADVLEEHTDKVKEIIKEWKISRYTESEIENAIREAVQDVNNWTFVYDPDRSRFHDIAIAAKNRKVLSDVSYSSEEFASAIGGDHGVWWSLSAWDWANILERFAGRAIPVPQDFTGRGQLSFNLVLKGQYVGDVNWEEVKRAVAEGFGVTPEESQGPKPREGTVVYEFKDGSYVTELPPALLKREGAELGICVGQPGMGYGDRIKRKQIKIFSMRTSAGRSKFCIEATLDANGNVSGIAQVKGKGNRQPGFDAGGGGRFKSGEVEALIEFIRFLGVNPKKVYDMQHAVLSLESKELYGKAAQQAVANPYRRRVVYNPALPIGRGHCSWCTR